MVNNKDNRVFMSRNYLNYLIVAHRELLNYLIVAPWYFFRQKTAVNYVTVKRQAGAEVSSFEVSSLESFFFRSTTVDI